MATGCALPQEYAVYRQRRRYEALGAMTVGKRKIESLGGGGGDDGEQGERYEKRGLSEGTWQPLRCTLSEQRKVWQKKARSSPKE
nr:hypothetical protein L203_02812 [Cryptococcus depauperatus CBS 7841]